MEFRWGIISTGSIATSFVKDILIDPKTRGVSDVVHKVVAVGSRDPQTAQAFINDILAGEETIKACTYEGVYADKRVDAVYIGTPNTSHYQNALDALNSGKHVLCEKPVTCTASELKSLLSIAVERDLFFMEALWTRFQPLIIDLRKVIDSGVIGAPVLLHADLSHDFDIQNIPKTHRILDRALGGGALLDLGPYPLVWALTLLFDHPKNKRTKPSSIQGAMIKTPRTGVDSTTAFILTFDEKNGGELSAHAMLSVSIVLTSSAGPTVTIRCERGTIEVLGRIHSPKSYVLKRIENGTVISEETKVFEFAGKGLHFQADEVARCVQSGKRESALWSHEHSLMEMAIFDEVRHQGGYQVYTVLAE